MNALMNALEKPVNVYLIKVKKNKSKVTVVIVFKYLYRSKIFSFAFNRNPAVFQAIITEDS